MKKLTFILIISILALSACQKPDTPAEPVEEICFQITELVYYPIPFRYDTIGALTLNYKTVLDTVCGYTLDELQMIYPGTDSIDGIPPYLYVIEMEFDTIQ